MTWGQGFERHRHKEVAIAAGLAICFRDPHSLWQRPINENTKGLVRDYFPNGTGLKVSSQVDLDYVACEMNDRPRKQPDHLKPNEILEPQLLC